MPLVLEQGRELGERSEREHAPVLVLRRPGREPHDAGAKVDLEPKKLTLRAYARHRGCAPSAVACALEYRRLSEFSAAKVGHRWQIDPVKADREWWENTNPEYQMGRER
jgi:hypothetical protein